MPGQSQPHQEVAERPYRGIDRFFRRHELAIILSLCVLAAIRVLAFSAGFPPFTNIDEQAHYSLVLDYAEGRIPANLERYNPQAGGVIARYGSPEYLASQERFDQGLVRPPLKDLPPELADAIAARATEEWRSRTNLESTQAPVYYAAAGAWYRLGELFGIHDIRLAYWIRFLNVLICGLLVWTAYAFIRQLYPGNLLLRTGVPLLLAFFPQDVFYSINNDVMTPLLYAVAFYSLLRIGLEESRTRGPYLVAGLSIAAVILVKMGNVTILVPMALVILALLRKARSEGRLRETLRLIGLMVGAAIIPIAVWMARNYIGSGDLTGASEKISALTWTYRPLDAIFDHPVFGPAGAWTFISGLIVTFWRGELVWHMVRMAMRSADIFYIASTLLFTTAAVVALIWRRGEQPAGERYAGWMGISALAASVGLMFMLSIMFDFGYCFYPSCEAPFLTSGRLMSGVMVPFLVLYITGLDWLMSRARLPISRLWVLLVIVALITASEIAINLPAFHSPYNWFHLS